MKRIGILASAGGSSFFNAVDILIASGKYHPKDFFLITDRECGAENHAIARNIDFLRIVEDHNSKFSEQAVNIFTQAGCDLVMLYFSRLVTETLFSYLPTLNIHPSLLPDFKGMGAVKRAYAERARFLGATLHITTNEMDGGPIIAQVVSPLSADITLELMQRISYLQKVYLTLCAIDLADNHIIEMTPSYQDFHWIKPFRTTYSASPALCSEIYVQAIHKLQREIGLEALVP